MEKIPQNREDWSEYRPVEFIYRGKWVDNWFSNMVPYPIEMHGVVYNSVENYYQAMKSMDPADWERVAAMTPSNAKRIGKMLKLRPDWEHLKEGFMYDALVAKFTQQPFMTILLDTGDQILIEWNNWGDRIWGVDIHDNKGQNLLGKLLMRIREELRHGK
jgi:ribA/ribD-fused uncharacterized protein